MNTYTKTLNNNSNQMQLPAARDFDIEQIFNFKYNHI